MVFSWVTLSSLAHYKLDCFSTCWCQKRLPSSSQLLPAQPLSLTQSQPKTKKGALLKISKSDSLIYKFLPSIQPVLCFLFPWPEKTAFLCLNCALESSFTQKPEEITGLIFFFFLFTGSCFVCFVRFPSYLWLGRWLCTSYFVVIRTGSPQTFLLLKVKQLGW